MVDIVHFRNDRSGVSPVIGVILMVAVTVIIAAVIGSAALGLSDGVSDPAPQVRFDVVETDSGMKITHISGDSIDGDQIRLAGDTTTETIPEWEGETVSAGDSATVQTTEGKMEVIWEGRNEDRSSQLASFDVSDTETVGEICRQYLNGMRVGSDNVFVEMGTVKNTPGDDVYLIIKNGGSEVDSATAEDGETVYLSRDDDYFKGATFTTQIFTEKGGELLDEHTETIGYGSNDFNYC